MKDSQPIILIGGGGHCKSVIDVLEMSEDFVIAGIVDKAYRVGAKVLGYDIIASDQQLEQVVADFSCFLITVGQIESSALREQFYQQVKALGGDLAIVVSSLAHVSDYAQLGEGTIVMHRAMVNAGAVVGCNTIINSQALVEHDVWIGDHCHMATGAIINGDAQIGHHTFIGSHATILQGVTIGENIIIGAGAVVHRPIDEPGVYAGVPACKIRDV